MSPSPIKATPQTLSLLTTLHAKSLAQEATLPPKIYSQIYSPSNPDFDTYMADKFIALEQDKCEFVYQLLRAMNATTVVEAGTSYGVSTIYLALAVSQNAATGFNGEKGVVIATEKEGEKARVAREYWAVAGEEVEGVIDLRVGDLRETLRGDVGWVDFLLLDIWTPMALPALKAVQPNMRAGAVIVADNTATANEGYRDLFEYLDREGSGFRRTTLPFKGGLEMIVYDPRS